MGRWSQDRRKGGARGEYRQARVTTLTLFQDFPGADLVLEAVIAPTPDRTVLWIYDAAAPTVPVATGSAGAVADVSISYSFFTVGHTYFGKVQVYRGPYVSQLQTSNNLVAA